MLFKPELCSKILNGEKTETRRIAKANERFLPRSKFHDLPAEVLITDRSGFERLKWQEGRCYAIQPGRGKPAIGYIRVIELREENLSEMGENNAIAEGTTSQPDEHHLSAFVRLWDSINPKRPFRSNPIVFVIKFELAFKVGR